jgi:hypothetical protein
LRGASSLLVLTLVIACAPPPKVAGHSQTAAPPAPSSRASAAPPPPPPSAPVESRPVPIAPISELAAPTVLTTEQELGVSAGFALEAMSPSGSYFAYCQPAGLSGRTPADMALDDRGNPGSPVQLTLAIGTERIDIDELLAVDPQGRFVVTLEDGAPLLRDTSLHKAFPLTALGIDLARDALPDHRSMAFSLDGTELALLTTLGGADPKVQILNLTAPDPLAAVRSVPLGPVRVWRVTAEADLFVVTSVTTSTAAGSKGPGWPVRSWSEPTLRCARSTYDAFTRVSGPLRDPTLTHTLVRRSQTSAEPAPGFVMATNGSWVRREDDGRLLLVQGKQQRQLASASCGGRILGADPRTGWFLISCEEYRPIKGEAPKPSPKKKPPPPKTRFPVYLLKPGVVRDVDLEIMRFGVDVPPVPGQRFTAVRSEAGLLLVDFAKGRAELLGTGDRLLLTTGTDVLLASSGKIVRWADGKRQELGPMGALTPIVASAAGGAGPSALAVGPVLYVQRTYESGAAGAAPTGAWESKTLARTPLALGAGFALVPAAEGTVSRWARGPVGVVLVDPATDRPPATATPATLAER